MAKQSAGGRQPVPTKTEMARRAADPLHTIRNLLETAKPRLAEVVPKHLTAERLVRFAVSAAAKTPKLLRCTPESMLAATLQAAGLGLEPNTPLQQCYFVPYDTRKNINGEWTTVSEVQFQIGYRGYILLALQAGIVTSVKAMLVYAKDKFVCKDGLSPVLDHEPTEEADRGPLRGAYCRWTMTSGERDFVYWPIARLEQHRDKYAPRDRNKKIVGPWGDPAGFGPMCLKTTVRDASRFWPMSPEKSGKLRDAMEADDASFDGDGLPLLDPRRLFEEGDDDGSEPTNVVEAALAESLTSAELEWLAESEAEYIGKPTQWKAAANMMSWPEERRVIVQAEIDRRVAAAAEDAKQAAAIDAGKEPGT